VLYPYNICVDHVCEHKALLPMLEEEWIGLVLLTALTVLANVAGIGGGGVIIPVTMALFGFSTKEAIALTSILMTFGSLTRFILQLDDRHPLRDAPVVDMNISILMLPIVLVGSFIGVIVNIWTPNIILSSCLTVILVLLAYRSLQTARKLYERETFNILNSPNNSNAPSFQMQDI